MRSTFRSSRLLAALLLLVAPLLLTIGIRGTAQVADPRGVDREEFARVYASLAADDAGGRLRLAAWAHQRGLHAEARKAWGEVIALDPECVPARRGLGHVRLRNRWVDDKNVRDAERAVLRARFEKAGLIRYRRGWETPDGARMRKQGLEYVDGKWRTPDMARAARGDVRIDGKWVGSRDALKEITRRRLGRLTGATFHVHLGQHVIVATAENAKAGRSLGDAMDRAVEDLFALRRAVGSPSPWKDPVRVIVLSRPQHLTAVNAWIPFHAGRAQLWFRPAADGVGIRLCRDTEGRPILIALVADGDEKARATSACCLLVYGITRLAVARISRTETPPYCLAEGLALFTQITRAPGGIVSCAGGRPPAARTPGAFSGPKSLRRLLDREGVLPLEKHLALKPDTATDRDLAQAALTVMFFTGRYPPVVAALLMPVPKKPKPGKRYDAGARLEAATGQSLAELDKEFAAWVRP